MKTRTALLTLALAAALSLAPAAPLAAQKVPSERPAYSLMAGRLVALDVLVPPAPFHEQPPRVRLVVALDGFRRAVEVRNVRTAAEVEALAEHLGRLVLVSAGIDRGPGGGAAYWTVPAQVVPLQG